MLFSDPTLHAPTLQTSAQKQLAQARIDALRQTRVAAPVMAVLATGTIDIPLTTVSLATMFDAYVDVGLEGAAPGTFSSLLVDSGNSVLVYPRWEDIAALSNGASSYEVLGDGNEPWGCPAKVVRGPIVLPTSTGNPFTIENCVFYACTDNAPNGSERTANFGTACLSPWSSSGWNTPLNVDVVLQAPLSYNASFPYAEFDYEAAGNVFSASSDPTVSAGSHLILYQTVPQGYTLLNIQPETMWMSLVPQSLAIGGTLTAWPGAVANPIAVIDTGGTCAFLSDPNGCVHNTAWLPAAGNPPWSQSSTACESTAASITVSLGDGSQSYSYEIDPSKIPPSAQGLTLVVCEENAYMMGRQGMNTGGISALVNNILVDYANCRIGLKAKNN